MHMQIEARAEPLHERHGARMKLARLAALLRRGLVMARELLGVDARERAEHLGLRRGQKRAMQGRGLDTSSRGAVAVVAGIGAYALARWLGSVRVVVGLDGVVLDRRLGSARFVPFGDLADVRVDAADVELVARVGPRVRLHDARLMSDGDRNIWGASLVALRDADLAGLAGCVRAAAASAASALERPRPDTEITAPASPYRARAVPCELALEVLDDVDAPPRIRLAAALALDGELDDAHREAARELAEGFVEPGARAALEAALGDGRLLRGRG
jgi:hypothetical protein